MRPREPDAVETGGSEQTTRVAAPIPYAVRTVPPDSLLLRPAGRLRFRDRSDRGRRELLSSLAARGLTTVYRRVFFLTYPLIGRRIPKYRANVDVEFGVLEPEDVALYRRFRPATPAMEINRRFARGDRCYIALRRGEIVDACWGATGRVEVPYLHCSLDLEPGDIYYYDSHTVPGCRGHGLYMARNSFASVTNQREGLIRGVAVVAAENYGVWLILTRSGMETIGRYDLLRLGPWRRYRAFAVEGGALPPLA
ncbi:MAG: hypothetical protein ACREK3_07650 [Gemmatimonadota bacterium]